MFSITATEKPKWHNLRWNLSNALVGLARWIYPRNPEVNAFMMQVMTDHMIYGQSVVRVNPAEMYKTPNAKVSEGENER